MRRFIASVGEFAGPFRRFVWAVKFRVAFFWFCGSLITYAYHTKNSVFSSAS